MKTVHPVTYANQIIRSKSDEELKDFAKDFIALTLRHQNLSRRTKIYKKQITEMQAKIEWLQQQSEMERLSRIIHSR